MTFRSIVLVGVDMQVDLLFLYNWYRVVSPQSKNNAPKMEIYCIMRNLILALWFYNNKVHL